VDKHGSETDICARLYHHQKSYISHEINPWVFPENGETICNHFALRGQLIRPNYPLHTPFYIISCSEANRTVPYSALALSSLKHILGIKFCMCVYP